MPARLLVASKTRIVDRRFILIIAGDNIMVISYSLLSPTTRVVILLRIVASNCPTTNSTLELKGIRSFWDIVSRIINNICAGSFD